MRLRYNAIKDKKLKAAIDAALASQCAESKPHKRKQQSLGTKTPLSWNVVNITMPVIVRITRVYSNKNRQYDHDNFVGGCKTLRDAITALLGRKSDTERDGISFEYEQAPGEKTETLIEIFEA